MEFVKNKVIVILGASSGIGAEISEYFCQRGAKVQLGARREERLKNVVDKINEKFDNEVPIAHYTVCDATKYEEVQKLSDDAIKNYGKIDLWVNCTGQNKAIGNTWELAPDVMWNEIDVNLHSCTNGTHVALQHMMKHNSGVIFNFCGGGTAQPHLYASAYSASKTAVARFTEAVHLELVEEKSKVKIFCGNPGLVLNERTHLLTVDADGLKFMPGIKTAFETGKHQPSSDIARYICYTMSGEIDGYAGKLAEAPRDIETVISNNNKYRDTSKGLLRIVE